MPVLAFHDVLLWRQTKRSLNPPLLVPGATSSFLQNHIRTCHRLGCSLSTWKSVSHWPCEVFHPIFRTLLFPLPTRIWRNSELIYHELNYSDDSNLTHLYFYFVLAKSLSSQSPSLKSPLYILSCQLNVCPVCTAAFLGLTSSNVFVSMDNDIHYFYQHSWAVWIVRYDYSQITLLNSPQTSALCCI